MVLNRPEVRNAQKKCRNYHEFMGEVVALQ